MQSIKNSDIDGCISELTTESRTSDRSVIAATVASPDSPIYDSPKTTVSIFAKLNHHSSDSELVAAIIKVPVVIHSWPDEQRKATLNQLVTGSQTIAAL